MPQLDLSDIPLDPLFADNFEVRRRVEVINDFGENGFQTSIFTPIGTVYPVSPASLDREADGQTTEKTIGIVTRFRLRYASPGYQADFILWHGDTYVVIEVKDWAGFGLGFIEATARSIDLLQAQPGSAIVGGF